ncbi:MAG: hypothetical protein QOI41_3681, partial [Myxococcales bacterium]|nr:hypothetical protein [Myxococcales bacterium]
MIRANIVYPNACSGTTIHCDGCWGTIPNGMPKDDDDRTQAPPPEALPSFATVPPPPGVIDEHSAPTTVAELPDSFLEELKAATKQEAASRAKGRDLQKTQRNQSFELELREQLTAQLVDVRVEPTAVAPSPSPSPLVAPSPSPSPLVAPAIEPTPSPAVEAVAPPESPPSEPPRAPVR